MICPKCKTDMEANAYYGSGIGNDGKGTVKDTEDKPRDKEKGLPPAQGEQEQEQESAGISAAGSSGSAGFSTADLALDKLTTASQFGITHITSGFMGLPSIADAERLVPALSLDLTEAAEEAVSHVLSVGIHAIEERIGSSFDLEELWNIHTYVALIRAQLLLAQLRRKDVCQTVIGTAPDRSEGGNVRSLI